MSGGGFGRRLAGRPATGRARRVHVIRILVALFLVCLAVLVAAMIYLPWWGFLLVLGGVFLALMGVGRLLTGRAAVWLFSAPFLAKGAVLKKARAEVHSAVPVTAPDRSHDEQDDSGPRDVYRIDVTVTPRPALGAF